VVGDRRGFDYAFGFPEIYVGQSERPDALSGVGREFRVMRRGFVLSAVAGVASAQQGWTSLFDGFTTTGWVEVTGKPFPSNCWTIEDGCLKALVRADGFQDIRTTALFWSFDLQFEWKLLAQGNSGVKYQLDKVDEWVNKEGRQARARGLEYQLADDADPDAASDPRRVAGSLYSKIAPSPKVPPRIGEFNQSRILLDRRHCEHWLNGVKVVSFEREEAPKESAISLQNHSSETWFRNLRIRQL
jgi:hypothetical protein